MWSVSDSSIETYIPVGPGTHVGLLIRFCFLGGCRNSLSAVMYDTYTCTTFLVWFGFFPGIFFRSRVTRAPHYGTCLHFYREKRSALPYSSPSPYFWTLSHSPKFAQKKTIPCLQLGNAEAQLIGIQQVYTCYIIQSGGRQHFNKNVLLR